MTGLDIRQGSMRPASVETALRAITTADSWVVAAKRTHSPGLVASAERDLQAAVDDARELGVQWGQIGLTLGIARGNAYQRYRKKTSHNDFRSDSGRQSRIA